MCGVLAAAGEGAILAGRRGPRRHCWVALDWTPAGRNWFQRKRCSLTGGGHTASPGGGKRMPERRAPRASDLCDRVMIRRSAAPRRGVAIPSGAGASGSNDLPWALPRVLQAIPKIKKAARENGWRADRGLDCVCSKDVSSAFGHDGRGSAIAASRAKRRRGPGRGGRPRRSIGPRRRANRSATGKAGVTGSASRAENHQ